MMTLSRRLADYASSLEFSNLPPQVIHEVKRRLIDSLGCALGAYGSPPGIIARGIGRRVESTYCATLLGTDRKTTPELATFANGVLIRYLDYNDTYLSREPAHPSDNISAAISVAEAENTGGEAVIAAIVLGYEVQCRLCDAASLRSRGWDHVAYVSVSSAILASRLMNLDRERMAHAISLSITPNIPLRQTRVGELSMWKGCAAANAARNGVFAALLAGEGMTGPLEVFEGEKGLVNQVTGPFDLDVYDFGGRGGDFMILQTYTKKYPSEYHSQAAVEAALELRKEVSVEEIEAIEIESYDACVDIIGGDSSKWAPKTRETADHSLPYCVAVALCDGKVGLDQFSKERIRDPKLKRIMDKVSVKRNPEHTRQYPASLPCLITISTRDGRCHSKTITYPEGHPENPMTDRELEQKFEALNQGLISDRQTGEIMERIWDLEKLRDVGALMRLFAIEG